MKDSIGSLATITAYRWCRSCYKAYETGEQVAQGNWIGLTSGTTCVDACPGCGCILEHKVRATYPRVTSLSDFVEGGVYFCRPVFENEDSRELYDGNRFVITKCFESREIEDDGPQLYVTVRQDVTHAPKHII